MAKPSWDNNKGLRLLQTNSETYLFLEPTPEWIPLLKPFMGLREINATWSQESKGWLVPVDRFPHINYFLEAVGDFDTKEVDSPGYIRSRPGEAPVRMLNFQEFKLLALLLERDNTWLASIYKTPSKSSFPSFNVGRWLHYPFKSPTREDIRDTKQWGSTQFIDVVDPLHPSKTTDPAGVDWIPGGSRISNLSDAFVDALAHTREQLDIESRYIQNRGHGENGVYDPDTPVLVGSGDIKRYTFIYIWGTSRVYPSTNYSNNIDVFLHDGHGWISALNYPLRSLPPQFTCPLPFPVFYFSSGIAPLNTLTPAVNPDFEARMDYEEFPPDNDDIKRYFFEINEGANVNNMSALRLTYNDDRMLLVYFVSTLATLHPTFERVAATIKDPSTVYIGFEDNIVACEIKLTPEEKKAQADEEELEDIEDDAEEVNDGDSEAADETEDGEALPAEEYMPPADNPWADHGLLQPTQINFHRNGPAPVIGGLPISNVPPPSDGGSSMGVIELPASQSPRGLPPIQMTFPQTSPRAVIGGLPIF